MINSPLTTEHYVLQVAADCNIIVLSVSTPRLRAGIFHMHGRKIKGFILFSLLVVALVVGVPFPDIVRTGTRFL